MNKIDTLTTIADLMKDFIKSEWGTNVRFSITVTLEGYVSIDFHSLPDYPTAVKVIRELGFKQWNKGSYNPDSPFSCVTAYKEHNKSRLYFNVFCAGLPPTCRIETVKNKIPKTEVIETKDFVEFETKKIVCGA